VTGKGETTIVKNRWVELWDLVSTCKKKFRFWGIYPVSYRPFL